MHALWFREPGSALPDTPAADEDEALRQLESFLEPRIEAAKDTTINKSVEQIFEETHQETQ